MGEAPDFLGMSDEDFLKQSPAAGEIAASKDAEVEEEASTGAEEDKTERTERKSPEGTTETTAHTQEEPSVDGEEVEPKKVVTKAPKKVVVAEVKKEETEANKDATAAQTSDNTENTEGEQTEGEVTETETPDYETFYKQIMTPFKANGRTVELKTPEEAIQLMQMGANYTKKMQELVPHRKLLTMLQNNGLTDEGKLSYLIDLDKKNPEAIKKLIKESGVDPLEIDTSVEPNYHEGNHRVSDEEVAFHQTLDDMKSSPERLGTLQVINGDWDQASKEALWKNPDIMNVIHGQRENGIYDRITTEVNRRKVLGQIPSNVPFLQAYKIVGDQMTEANAFADLNIKAPVQQQQSKTTPEVVATRVAAPKPAVKNGARAAAASTSRQTSGKVQESSKNPLSMSDEEFMKLDHFSGRV